MVLVTAQGRATLAKRIHRLAVALIREARRNRLVPLLASGAVGTTAGVYRALTSTRVLLIPAGPQPEFRFLPDALVIAPVSVYPVIAAHLVRVIYLAVLAINVRQASHCITEYAVQPDRIRLTVYTVVRPATAIIGIVLASSVPTAHVLIRQVTAATTIVVRLQVIPAACPVHVLQHAQRRVPQESIPLTGHVVPQAGLLPLPAVIQTGSPTAVHPAAPRFG